MNCGFSFGTERAKLGLNEQGFNCELYYENKDFKSNLSIVPTSAHTGEGIPDLLFLVVKLCQTVLTKQITFTNVLNCTVMEVKKIDGHGTTIDVILADGTLKEGDTIVLAGLEGPIVTQIRSLLMPEPLKVGGGLCVYTVLTILLPTMTPLDGRWCGYTVCQLSCSRWFH